MGLLLCLEDFLVGDSDSAKTRLEEGMHWVMWYLPVLNYGKFHGT